MKVQNPASQWPATGMHAAEGQAMYDLQHATGLKVARTMQEAHGIQSNQKHAMYPTNQEAMQ
eukprot:12684075-Prorocentrum_lima.AAC.1